MTDRIAAAARGLHTARRENRIALLDPDIAPRNLNEAYATHLALLDLLSADGGGPRIGWKVGFTNDAAQQRMGATEPIFAGLLGQHTYVAEAEITGPGGSGLGIEAELAVRLGSPLAGPVSRQQAASAIEAVTIAIEIVQKRGGVEEIGLPTLVADGTLQYGSVFGSWNSSFDPLTMKESDVKLQIDGQTDGFMSASEVLGDPLNALTWLAQTTERHGVQLKAGDVILLGAIIPPQHLNPGQFAEVASEDLGDVRVWMD